MPITQAMATIKVIGLITVTIYYHVIKHATSIYVITEFLALMFLSGLLKAGIPSKHLCIALEPEAASLFCQYLPVEKFSSGGQVGFSDAKPGTTYMIVDLGGNL